jgi:starch synthase
VSCIARLVPQKGPELMKFALLRTLERGGQFVLLGSAHDKETHTHFYNLKRKLAGSRHVHIELSYNESMSHLVYAASDLFLIPSRFEPCGLTQMIAMRYGTVPLVRKTGGLADTVFENKNGFLFSDFTAEGILSALDRSIDCWFDDPVKWRSLMSAGMNRDFSWNYPTEEYLKIYRKILKRK